MRGMGPVVSQGARPRGPSATKSASPPSCSASIRRARFLCRGAADHVAIYDELLFGLRPRAQRQAQDRARRRAALSERSVRRGRSSCRPRLSTALRKYAEPYEPPPRSGRRAIIASTMPATADLPPPKRLRRCSTDFNLFEPEPRSFERTRPMALPRLTIPRATSK